MQLRKGFLTKQILERNKMNAYQNLVLLKSANIISESIVKYNNKSLTKKQMVEIITNAKELVKKEFPHYLHNQHIFTVVNCINNIIFTIETNRKNKSTIQLCKDYWNQLIAAYEFICI